MVDELVKNVENIEKYYKQNELSDAELVSLKGEANILKSKLYVEIDEFNSRAMCFMYINTLNSLIENIEFKLNYNRKLLTKIKERLYTVLTKKQYMDLIEECKKEIR